MDLSRLTRPAILCQCSRCSSSLAALENEWAKVSNSYSIATEWLSVDLHRISISSEKKQIPPTSDMSLLRGRILQEIACKLCQQKLGVLCALDNGPNIFWKLSKVAFREIVTMRTVEPVFNERALERLLHPPPKESSLTGSRRDRNSIQPGALVPAGSSEVDGYNISVSQQIQTQGLSLDHITSSVSNLHDTMSELKHAFTALRIELNVPNRFSSETDISNGNDFDMIKTVLKELRAKSEEIERLKLEMEALRLKNRFMEEQAAKSSPSTLAIETTLPQVQSPGLLQGSRKRPWPDSFPSGRTHQIADSFEDDEDIFENMSLADPQSVKIPLKDHETMPSLTNTPQDQTTPGSSRFRLEVSQSRQQSPYTENMADTIRDSQSSPQQQPIVKRPRLTQQPTDKPPSSTGTEKKKAGRPRKSFSQGPKPEIPQTPKATPLSEQNANTNGSNQKENPALNTSPSEHHQKGIRPTRSRSIRSRSRPPSSRITRQSDVGGNPTKPDSPQGEQSNGNGQAHTNNNGDIETDQKPSSGKEIPPPTTNGVQEHEENHEIHKKRKAQVAARDTMARLAMQREEAMETEESR
ncbi:hypothetical protein MW887_004235 [Aspergillus wentii]|nr:hypothetical protein MW887_004235 [Aspergillus wentii]